MTLNILGFFKKKVIMDIFVFLECDIGYFVFSECDRGYFGLICKNQCSPNCLDPLSCDHVTGTCAEGCKDGWVDSKCVDGATYRKLKICLRVNNKLNAFKIQIILLYLFRNPPYGMCPIAIALFVRSYVGTFYDTR